MDTLFLEPSEKLEIYRHVNASGTLYVRISDTEGSGQAKLWWTKGPFGTNKHLGIKDGEFSIEIEGLLWGRLKAQALTRKIAIQIHDNPSVAFNFPSISF